MRSSNTKDYNSLETSNTKNIKG